MAGSMNIKHSRNWSLLFKLLNNQTGEFNHERIPQLSAHLQAKALSIFLANASLATPALDRDTVTAMKALYRRIYPFPFLKMQDCYHSMPTGVASMLRRGLMSVPLIKIFRTFCRW